MSLDNNLKKITAIIQAYKLDDVRDALQPLGIGGLTVQEVMGYGRQRGHNEFYRGTEYRVEFVPKVKLELIILETLAPEAIAVIQKSAHTGRIGDGKIFVEPIEEVVRIRTGERGSDAV